jgi:hypothetical protein
MRVWLWRLEDRWTVCLLVCLVWLVVVTPRDFQQLRLAPSRTFLYIRFLLQNSGQTTDVFYKNRVATAPILLLLLVVILLKKVHFSLSQSHIKCENTKSTLPSLSSLSCSFALLCNKSPPPTTFFLLDLCVGEIVVYSSMYV